MPTAQPYRRYKMRPDDARLIDKGPSNSVVDVYGDRIPQRRQINFNYVDPSKLLSVETKNIRLLGDRTESIRDREKCKARETAPPFEGGQVDTAWYVFISYIQEGELRFNRFTAVGKLISPRPEIQGDRWVYISESDDGTRDVSPLGIVTGQRALYGIKIIKIERRDGGDILEGGSLPLRENYYCAIDALPSWNAGERLDNVVASKDTIRRAQHFYEQDTYHSLLIAPNQPKGWSIKVT